MKSVFIEQVLSNCQQYANKVAIVDKEGSRNTTYMELYQLALKVSSYINQQLIPEHSFISVRMPNCMEFMAAELGIWLANCAAVPMGMNSPEERTATIMKDCECPLLIDLDLMGEIGNRPEEDSVSPKVPEQTDEALLIYTSGSTGKPKGILHTFLSFINLFHLTGHPLLSSPEQVFGCAAAFYFGAIAFAYDRLRDGATIHIYSDRVKSDPQALAEYIKEHSINVSHISPGVLMKFHNLSGSLKAVVTAGERLTTQHSKEGYSLYNYLGMSETLGAITYYCVDDHPMEVVPLGHTTDWVEYRIEKEDGSLANTGEEGELCIRGNFCKYYYKDSERTAQLYVDGWLHSRDIVKLGDDGLLYYRNRKDWMIKINGQRVEPGEVETAIRKMEGVNDVVVKGFDNGRGSLYLCAFYVADRTINNKKFNAHLSGLLPPYMHPSIFIRKDAFPVNANGKTDRMALTAPEISHSKEDIVLPCSGKEMHMLEIAREILERDDFGVTDNLVEMGMDSLRATEMVHMAEKKLITLKVNDILTKGTIRDLAMMNQSLIYWYRPFQEGKKIVVVAAGLVGILELDERLAGIADDYNVMVIEQLFDHYLYLLDGHEQLDTLAGLYYDLLDDAIDDKSLLHGFMGFSFGGTIAYAIAKMYEAETGRTYKVICGDSLLELPPYVQPTPEEKAKALEIIAAGDPVPNPINDEMIYQGQQVCGKLMSNYEIGTTNNEVLLFRCMGENDGKVIEEYLPRVKNLKVIEVNDIHVEFCADFHARWYKFTIQHVLEFLQDL